MRSKYWIQASIVVSYITCFLFKMYNMIFRLVVFKVWKLIASASLENLCVCVFFKCEPLVKDFIALLQYYFCIVVLFCLICFSEPHGMWDLSSPTTDQTHTPCMGKGSLNHWTTREVPGNLYKAQILGFYSKLTVSETLQEAPEICVFNKLSK